MASQPLQLSSLTPLPFLSLSSSSSLHLPSFFPYKLFRNEQFTRPNLTLLHRRLTTTCVPFAGTEETELRVSSPEEDQQEEDGEPTAEDIAYVSEIERVLDLLKKNRDMLFGEVKLTIMIEDPREVERRRLLGLEGPDAPTRDDLVTALEETYEGKIPKNKAALKMLAAELASWPNLEVESTKKKPSKSLYAKTTDTGIDPREAAKRLNVDWDSAAEIQDTDVIDDTEVPPVVGYGALYLVTAFPIIIGVSVVLILFYNSLQ